MPKRGAPVDLMPQAGCFWSGTLSQYAGMWREFRGARKAGTSIEPIRRPRAISVTPWTGGIAVSGVPRSVINWRVTGATPRSVFGTNEGIYRIRFQASGSSELHDLTPAGFTPGQDTDLWHIDYSETIQGPYYVFEPERIIYVYPTGGNGVVPSQPLANAPNCNALVCSYIPGQPPIAIQANGQSNLIAWPDNEDHTQWAPDTTNNAGDLLLSDTTPLRCGRTFLSQVLIWSDTSLHVGQFVNGEYAFRNAGHCRLIGPNSIAVTSFAVYWLGSNRAGEIRTFVYDGSAVREIECTIEDLVERELVEAGTESGEVAPFPDATDLRRVFAQHRPSHAEIWWWLPQTTTTGTKQYAAVYNYASGIWFTGYNANPASPYSCAAEEGAAPWGFTISSDGVTPAYVQDELDDRYEVMELYTNLLEADPERYTCLNEVRLDIDGGTNRDYSVSGYSKDTPFSESLTLIGTKVVDDVNLPVLDLGRFTMRWKGKYGMQLKIEVGAVRAPIDDLYRIGRTRLVMKPGARRR